MRIMLDPGHSGSFANASPVVNGYFESNMTWSLALKLRRALEARGFEVGLTRQNRDEDPELTERGRRARGYDLFLSLHSNASASESADAPWLIHFSHDGKTNLDERSEAAAVALGYAVSRIMGVSEPFFYTKSADFDRDGNGQLDDEWYGVLYGAKSVGVPGVIVEHSFHTNESAARWLLDEDNLEKLAKAEADALSGLYGMEENGMTEVERELLDTLANRIEALEEKVDAHNEQIGVKWAYIDKNLPDWAAPTVRKLRDSGALKGNNANSYELSRLMLRLLVILDREGVFD